MNPLQAANAGDFDVFLAKLDPAGSALVFSTYLGGSSWDKPSGLALRLGDVFLQGTTASTDFPVMNALQSENAGGLDSFVARIRPTTTSPSTSLSPSAGAARANAKKGGTATLDVKPQQHRLYRGPFAKRIRPAR